MMVGCFVSILDVNSGCGGGTYHEQGKGIQRKRHRVESKSIQPHLGILECVQHRRPGEWLVVHGIVVVSQSVLDELSFLLGQELGGCWVVVDPKVRNNGHDHGQETFLFSISRVVSRWSLGVFGVWHTRMKIHRQPL